MIATPQVKRYPVNTPLAQMVERLFYIQDVTGSIPVGCTNNKGELSNWLAQQTVNLSS